jgi:hypothetical protein
MLFSLTTSELPSTPRWLPEEKLLFLRAQAVSCVSEKAYTIA